MIILGSGKLPGPVEEFHLKGMTNTTVTMSWKRPDDSHVHHYELNYGPTNSEANQKVLLKMPKVSHEILLLKMPRLSAKSIVQNA